jgi:hypothetical protein
MTYRPAGACPPRRITAAVRTAHTIAAAGAPSTPADPNRDRPTAITPGTMATPGPAVCLDEFHDSR